MLERETRDDNLGYQQNGEEHRADHWQDEREFDERLTAFGSHRPCARRNAVACA